MEDKYRRTAVIKIETNIITNITTIQIVQAVIILVDAFIILSIINGNLML